jgi:TetR/AcrR family transcriptional regulator
VKRSKKSAKSPRPIPWKSSILDLEEQRALKGRAILREAGSAFGRYGFHNTSLDDVARALNISKPTLYNYYPTKHQLLFECHQLALDLGDDSMKVARHGATGLEKVLLLVQHYVSHKAGDLGEFAVLTDFHSLLPEHRKIIQTRRDRFDRELRSFIQQGIEDGTIEPCDPTVAVAYFMGAINWLSVWYSPNGPCSPETISEHFTRFVEGGIRARKPAAKSRSRSAAPTKKLSRPQSE